MFCAAINIRRNSGVCANEKWRPRHRDFMQIRHTTNGKFSPTISKTSYLYFKLFYGLWRNKHVVRHEKLILVPHSAYEKQAKGGGNLLRNNEQQFNVTVPIIFHPKIVSCLLFKQIHFKLWVTHKRIWRT